MPCLQTHDKTEFQSEDPPILISRDKMTVQRKNFPKTKNEKEFYFLIWSVYSLSYPVSI